MRTKHETTLLEILAAMLPEGEERSKTLNELGAPDEDAERDGDLYRVSSDDAELSHWADVVRSALSS